MMTQPIVADSRRRLRRHSDPGKKRAVLCGVLLAFLPGCSGCVSEEASSNSPGAEEVTSSGEKESAPSQSPTTSGGSSSAKSGGTSHSRHLSQDQGGGVIANRPASGGSESSAADDPAGTATAAGPAAKTPAAALAQAQGLRETARQLSEEGEPGAAYQKTVRAWELVRRFPDDPSCAACAEELLAQMEALGQRANRSSGAKAADGPLLVR